MPLLDRARNVMGPLTPDVKARITRFFDEPTVENWDNIHGIVISFGANRPTYTIWSAVAELDRRMEKAGKTYFKGAAPKDRWKRFPNALAVARAIKYALDNRERIR